jgi:hypothetical protein
MGGVAYKLVMNGSQRVVPVPKAHAMLFCRVKCDPCLNGNERVTTRVLVDTEPAGGEDVWGEEKRSWLAFIIR